jgi:acyl-coenzyme A synthetase/AMP-(fatty) acid ligase/acyl carrier protein
MQQELALTAIDRLLAVTTLSFDIAAMELFLPLLNGARLVLLPQSEIGDWKRIVQRMEVAAITVMQTVPSLWQLLLASDWPATTRLKAITGGEALTNSLARQLAQKAAAVWNVYGPTETTIWSTLARIEEGQPVNIGGPLANTQVYVLDRWLQPVPVGVVGELYIGGCGLARGYLRRADLTAERFVPDAWSQEPGARLYRTGDLARYRSDGRLEVVGRSDSQIKLRGFRIELGEIESVLQQHPGVQEGAVLLREDRLVAYLVMKKGQEEPTLSALHSWVGERLPAYMQLAAFVLLEQLPRLPNGKLDRSVLPEPDRERPQLDAGYVAPRTEIERRLVEIWQEVLQLERVGVQDAFFELGGHSLQLMQVQQRLEEIAGISLPLMTFFQYPRIDALARYLSREEDTLQTFWQKDQLGKKLQAGKSRLGQRLAQRRQEKRR